jgi:hypothetical protein
MHSECGDCYGNVGHNLVECLHQKNVGVGTEQRCKRSKVKGQMPDQDLSSTDRLRLSTIVYLYCLCSFQSSHFASCCIVQDTDGDCATIRLRKKSCCIPFFHGGVYFLLGLEREQKGGYEISQHFQKESRNYELLAR